MKLPSFGWCKRALELTGDMLAILALPALTTFAAGLALVLWLGGWKPETQAQRINYLGAALAATLLIIAFGYLKAWKYALRGVRGKFGAAELDVDLSQEEPKP